MSDKGRRTMKTTDSNSHNDFRSHRQPRRDFACAVPTIGLSLPVQSFLNSAKIETSHEIAP
jgi:hypothetical protein